MNYPTEDDYRAELKARDGKYIASLRTHSMHQKHDLDWSQFHPNAADILYHSDLWSETDPRMPHGNDFGKHILNNFDTFNDLPLSDVLKKLGLTPYKTAPSSTHKNQALQAEVGIIFAYIKKTGTCPKQMADDLLDRMLIESNVKNSFWVFRDRHGTGSHFEWMQYYLTDFATDAHRLMSSEFALTIAPLCTGCAAQFPAVFAKRPHTLDPKQF